MEIISALFDDMSVSDDTYAEELHFQEVLEDSLKMSTSLKSSSSHASSSQISCEICIEDKQQHEMFQIKGCLHSFCSVCVSKHVESKLQENIALISCPACNCNNILEPACLMSIIPPNVITRWEDAFIELTIPATEKFYCPYEDCSEILLNDNDEGIVIRESECPICRRLFCAQCRVPWHPEFDCEQFKRLNKEEKEEHKLRLLAQEKNWKVCPNCKNLVEKNEGCIHMTCRCMFEFCYICGSDWNESHWSCQDRTDAI